MGVQGEELEVNCNICEDRGLAVQTPGDLRNGCVATVLLRGLRAVRGHAFLLVGQRCTLMASHRIHWAGERTAKARRVLRRCDPDGSLLEFSRACQEGWLSET